MAVAFDAWSRDTTPGTGDQSWTHTPVGTPRGAVVLIGGITGTDEITSVTYGGTAMTEVTGSPNALGTGETGITHVFVLGASVPTGAQTVAYTTSGSTTSHQGYCVTVTGAADTEWVASVTWSDAALADPTGTLSVGGRTCWVGQVLYSGQNATTGIGPLAGWTNQHEIQTGTETIACYTYDTVGSTDVTVGWTQTAEDACGIAVAISEVAAAGGQPTVKRHGGVPGMGRLLMGPGWGGRIWGRIGGLRAA